MEFDKALYDGEPKAKTPVLASRARIGLPEPIEDVWQGIWRNASTGVGNNNDSMQTPSLKGDRDIAARRRELESI